ncbi:hypothetical protein [Alteribacter populi]|uniref:hypothetical protein n=1 Tax=Alteribacter populi TaxID=2011011 RepID=UPI000BBA4415|nr:hypothetical protein [Alteribacter populi]
MSPLIDRLNDVSKHIGEGVTNLFKRGEKRNIRIRDLASSILTHQETTKKSRAMLGLVFNEYRLSIGPVAFKLETKGKNDEHILELSAMEQGVKLFTYKSFDEKHSEKDKHPLPEYAYHYLTKA